MPCRPGFFAIVIFCSFFNPSRVFALHEVLTTAENRILEIRAAELVDAYQEDVYEADIKYYNRIFKVQGQVYQNAEYQYNKPCLMLKASSHGEDWLCCLFNRADYKKVIALEPFDQVTLIGICIGRFDHVYLDNCFLYATVETPITPLEKKYRRLLQTLEKSSLKITVLSTDLAPDYSGQAEVKVRLQNNSYLRSSGVFVKCILFDELYRMIGSSGMRLRPYALLPGEQMPYSFKIKCDFSKYRYLAFELDFKPFREEGLH
ncbi:MAG: hypothetical protein PHW04_16900 [Candidatus Wallbacteria bacterium]|nr:hypothetical protein [Candidatus Wallbacteria bacterium]